jgi:hypothetical protein
MMEIDGMAGMKWGERGGSIRIRSFPWLGEFFLFKPNIPMCRFLPLSLLFLLASCLELWFGETDMC